MRYRVTVRSDTVELRGTAASNEDLITLSSLFNPDRRFMVIASVLTPPALSYIEQTEALRTAVQQMLSAYDQYVDRSELDLEELSDEVEKLREMV